MSRYTYDDWERKKSYLIRSLFQDIPLLSPVAEENASSPSPARVDPLRSTSPLPPLIIEKMPDRHDHPKEYYDYLEKKMRKVYKKIFYNRGSKSVDDFINKYDRDYENIGSPISNIDENYETEGATVSDYERSQSSTTTDHNDTETTNDILIHRTASNADDDDQINVDIDTGTETSHSGIVLTVVEVSNTDIKTEHDTSEGSRNPVDSDVTSDSDIENTSIELMRRQEVTSPAFRSFFSDQNDSTGRLRISSPKNVIFNHSRDRDISSHTRSTESMNRERTFIHNSHTNGVNESQKRSISSVSKTDEPTSKRRRSVGIQTMMSEESHEETVHWDLIKNNFFVGTPKVFNLCTCKGHVCLNEQ
ncbi:hypothetical protein ACJJTC_010795 [Scirpophaga incertulas]